MTSLTCLQLRPKKVSCNFARISETKHLFRQGKLTVGLRFSTNTSETKIKKPKNQVYGTQSVWDMIQKQSLFTTNNCHLSHKSLRMNLLLLFNHPLELSLRQRESWKSRMASLCILKYTEPQLENSGTHTPILTQFTNNGKSTWENTLWMLLRVCRVVNSQLDFTSDGYLQKGLSSNQLCKVFWLHSSLRLSFSLSCHATCCWQFGQLSA